MKHLFIRLIKISLIVLAVLLAILLIFGAVLLLDWPWWVGFFLLLGLIGLGLGFLFIRKIWGRRREQRFVQQVIEQDESHLHTLSGKERDDLKELQNRWKEAIDALRRSHLRKYGNPLYVLPWYLVIGESGSGKTTAINSAHLSSPFTEVSHISGISGTRNCHWWFFEQAIIIDTAGRYAIPIDEDRDKEEWQRFLSLLIKYREKEPINGLIVTISADKLLEGLPEVLEEEGRNIRRRIDELMRVLGAKFPVYVLVTKCDLIQGMTQFSDQLPEESLNQPMGVINQDLSIDVMAFQEKTFETLGERLRNLRILLLHRSESKEIDPPLLLFPEEFTNVRRGLDSFIKGAFQENPYQETPVLRGLFFSSGRQEGSPYSHFLKALGLIGEKEVLPGTSKGLFLHDLFAKILPKDRGLLAPTKRALQWRILTRNLGLTSWIVLGVAICGLLSFSFVKNLKTIREASHDFAKPFLLQGEMLSDLNTMDRLCQAILRVEDQNRNWWVPRFGLRESIDVEMGLKRRYCKQFQEEFLASFDKRLGGRLAKLADTTSDEEVGPYVAHLARRINLLKARLEGQSLEMVRKKPQPSYGAAVEMTDPKVLSDLQKKFGNLYLYYVVWRMDSGEINKEMAILQSWLKHLLSLRGFRLRWLVAWLNQETTLPPVQLRDFWGGNTPATTETTVSPALTRKGKEQIDTFVREIESALPDPMILANQKSEFERWYRQVCCEAWQNFGVHFSNGKERLKNKEEWQQMAAKMATDEGPYFSLLNRIAWELEMVDRGEGLPPWLKQVYQYQILKAQGPTGGWVAKAAEEGKRLIGKIEKQIGREVGESLESQSTVIKAYQEYHQNLTTITSVSDSRSQAYQLASQVFTEDPTTSKSPFFVAQGTVSRLKTGLRGGAADEVFWKLISGPIEYLWAFVRMESACHLQSQWEQQVLSETQGVTGSQAKKVLFSPEGPVLKFIKGPVAPFITWNTQKGYVAKEVLGGSIPFDNAFLSFLRHRAFSQQATALTTYKVLIKGLPTYANLEARLKPHTTRLELQCTSGQQSLVNINVDVSKTFQWSPEVCSDVTLKIEVGDVILTKKYPGDQAFPEFLQDFQGGQCQFSPDDFPDEKVSLERFGIQQIRVRYEFSGDHQQVIGQLSAFPKEAPRNMVSCWSQ